MSEPYIDRFGKSISYVKGLKYQLTEQAVIFVGDLGQKETIELDWLILTKEGYLKPKKGYAWDGPSGPTIDTRGLMRGSLLHDCIYELIRKEFLPPSAKLLADSMYYEQIIVDGTWKLRGKWHWWGVDRKGKNSTLPSRKRKVLSAP